MVLRTIAALMALQWYGKAGTYTEEKLANFRHSLKNVHVEGFPDGYPGTTLNQMEDIFQKVGALPMKIPIRIKRKIKRLRRSVFKKNLNRGIQSW